MKRPCDGQTWMADVDAAMTRHNREYHPAYLRAKDICARCPIAVKTDCLRYALTHEVAGFVAGTLEKERNRMRRAAA